MSFGSVLGPAKPSSIVRYGSARPISRPEERTSDSHGRAITRRAAPAQKPLKSSASARRETSGTDSRFTRSPSRLSNAGSNVSPTITDAIAAKIAPVARALNRLTGRISSPINAITTVMPENSTARPAVSPATAIASSFSRPRRRSSRKRSTISSE